MFDIEFKESDIATEWLVCPITGLISLRIIHVPTQLSIECDDPRVDPRVSIFDYTVWSDHVRYLREKVREFVNERH